MNSPGNENPDLSVMAAGYIAFLCILFGANTVAIKLAFTGLGQFTSAGLRFAIAAVTICIWARLTRRPFRLKRNQLPPLVILSATFLAQLSLFYLGLSKTYASRGALIVNLLPFFVLFLSHFFIPGDSLTKRKFFGILLGFVGICFIFGESPKLDNEFRMGDFIIFGGVIMWAANVVYTKKIIERYQPFQLVVYPMIIAVPFFFLQAFLFDPVMVGAIDKTVVLSLMYQSFITASFGFVAWSGLLKKYGASTLHSFVFLMPVSAVLFSGLILREPITTDILMAAIFITSGILIVHLKPRRITPSFPLGRGL